ncbi:MAG: AraC family transcriptional regulator [Lachnospiraceae bacterium]|nr:AraC family transcriptional regulator [Lachnospiraceae bacterium]
MKSRYEIVSIGKTRDREILFEERETGFTHLPFKYELAMCNAIKQGNSVELSALIDDILSDVIITGHLAGSEPMRLKYWAVTVVANAIHYAILGGLDETDAYNFSDMCIRSIDAAGDADTCIGILTGYAGELVKMVEGSMGKSYSPGIKKTLHYIHVHLHEKILIETLAGIADLSKDYLCVLFKKETGVTVHDHIIDEKLKESIKLMEGGMRPKEVSFVLAFSSQSHFTQAFKKKYGVTPAVYQKNM